MQIRHVLTAICLLFCFGGMAAQAQEMVGKVRGAIAGHNNHANLVVRVTLDAHGRVSSAMIVKSSGSAILDHHCVAYAKQNWKGPPNTTKDVPCYYKLGAKPNNALQPTAKGGG